MPTQMLSTLGICQCCWGDVFWSWWLELRHWGCLAKFAFLSLVVVTHAGVRVRLWFFKGLKQYQLGEGGWTIREKTEKLIIFKSLESSTFNLKLWVGAGAKSIKHCKQNKNARTLHPHRSTIFSIIRTNTYARECFMEWFEYFLICL